MQEEHETHQEVCVCVCVRLRLLVLACTMLQHSTALYFT